MRTLICGSMAFDMMLMTATGQVSLDWRDEADCVRKVTASVRISPLLLALFANSPLAQGRPTGFLSYRSRAWNDVDPARCGYPQAMLDGSTHLVIGRPITRAENPNEMLKSILSSLA